MFSTFSKNRQIWELFQKRFATGICDFKGALTMYSFTPYTSHTTTVVCSKIGGGPPELTHGLGSVSGTHMY